VCVRYGHVGSDPVCGKLRAGRPRFGTLKGELELASFGRGRLTRKLRGWLRRDKESCLAAGKQQVVLRRDSGKVEGVMKNRRMGKSIVHIFCGMLIAVGWNVGAATLDLGVLPPDASDSTGFGISRTGRAVGVSSGKAFRTQKNLPISNAAGDNLHNSLNQLIGPIGGSEALDIHQYYVEPMEIVGKADGRPFWYQEADNGSLKYARMLYAGSGAAKSVKPDTSGYGGATAVVGNVVGANGMNQAAYWSVIPSQHWLYNFGAIYFRVNRAFSRTRIGIGMWATVEGSLPTRMRSSWIMGFMG
jgi:hypothetical protein